MKVLVCDSGIMKTQKESFFYTDIGQGVWDDNSHGATVCDVIKLLSGKTEIESVKILDKNNETTLDILIKALKYGLYSDCDIICLALTIDSSKDCQSLHHMLETISNSGKLIIAANRNCFKESIPANYPFVLGTQIHRENDSTVIYSSERPIQSIIPLNAIIRILEDDNCSILGGNSLACAVISGEVAYLLEKNRITPHLAQHKLKELSWNSYRINKFLSNYSIASNMTMYSTVYRRVKSILKEVNLTESLYLSPNFQMQEVIKIMSSYGLIHKNDKYILQITDLHNVESIARYICSNISKT